MKSTDSSEFLECINWEEAVAQSVGYEGAELISHYSTQFALDKPWLQKRSHSKPEDLDLSERQENLFFGFAIAIAKLKKKQIRVLDIGGGNGYMAYWIRDFFPEQTFEWVILESESVAESYNEWKKEASIDWIYRDAFNDTFDVILISCTLQYLENWSQVLVDSVRSCKMLFLMRLPILESNKHKFGVQYIFRKSLGRNFDASVPCHFFGAKEIFNQISPLMKPLYKLVYNDESVIFENKEVRFQDYLFSK